MNFVNILADYVCPGLIGDNGLPVSLAHIIALAYKIIQIAVPILLIIWGMLDLLKGVISQKEDEIKKGQQVFVKRLIAAVIVFFVVVIVKLVIDVVASAGGDGLDSKKIIDCIDAILGS